MAAVANAEFTLRTEGEEPERLEGARVSWTLPRVLGVTPRLGRAFTAADDAAGAPPVMIVSDRLWRTRFGADPSLVGRAVDINGRQTVVVGVLPPDVRYPDARGDAWMPFALPDSAWSGQRGNHQYDAVARLAPGVTLAAARTELAGIAARLAAEYPDFQRDFSATAIPFHEAMTGSVRAVLLVLLGAVSFVLLIACANVANLTLARGAARQREVALRAAIGASRTDLVRQQLAESVVLGLGGAAIGLVLAAWAVAALPTLVPTSIPRLADAGLDWRMALFTLGAALVASIAAGVVPALQTSRTDLNAVLKDGGKGAASGAVRARTRDGLFVAEVAFALLLLTGAGLALTSLGRLLSVQPGFAPERVLTARVALPGARYRSDTARTQFWAQLLPALRAQPGVTAAGVVSMLPLGGGMAYASYTVDGRPAVSGNDQPLAMQYFADDGYFRALGVPVKRGRVFEPRDVRGAPGVAVVSEALVRDQFRGEDPIGRRVRPFGDEGPAFEIVGVVGDVRHRSLAEEARPALYLPMAQVGTARGAIVVRTSGDPAAVTGALRRAVASVDPTLAVADVQPMAGVVGASVARPRFSAVLLGAFAGCAVVLALVGIYGVVAQGVAQRRAEFGVRMALGARPADVRRDVIGGAMRRAGIGIAIGLGGAAALTRLMAEELYDTSPLDPPVLLSMSLAVVAVTVAASWIPARRATRVSVMTVLRNE
jgi:putative ABC transport system permease protein